MEKIACHEGEDLRPICQVHLENDMFVSEVELNERGNCEVKP